MKPGLSARLGPIRRRAWAEPALRSEPVAAVLLEPEPELVVPAWHSVGIEAVPWWR
jgi:hypothetical protein